MRPSQCLGIHNWKSNLLINPQTGKHFNGYIIQAPWYENILTDSVLKWQKIYVNDLCYNADSYAAFAILVNRFFDFRKHSPGEAAAAAEAAAEEVAAATVVGVPENSKKVAAEASIHARLKTDRSVPSQHQLPEATRPTKKPRMLKTPPPPQEAHMTECACGNALATRQDPMCPICADQVLKALNN